MTENARWTRWAFAICLAFMLTGRAFATESFVGNKGCSGCHKQEAREWQRSTHAKAFELLSPGKRPKEKRQADLDPTKDYQTDEKCLKCHTTGYKAEGGFKSVEETPELIGVGCEMCHGAGKRYREIHKRMAVDFNVPEARAAGQVYATLKDKVCENCHGHKDGPMLENIDPKYAFDLNSAMKKAATSFHRITQPNGKNK